MDQKQGAAPGHGKVTLEQSLVPRQWLLTLLSEFIRSPVERILLITGVSGSGKSTLVDLAAQRAPNALTYYIRRDSRTLLLGTDARSLLLDIGLQFANKSPQLFQSATADIQIRQSAEYVSSRGQLIGIKARKHLTSPFTPQKVRVEQQVSSVEGSVVGLSVDEIMDTVRILSVPDLEELALREPLSRLAQQDPTAKVVLFVDALDELRYHSRDEGTIDLVSWVSTIRGIPLNLKIVLTSRPNNRLAQNLKSSYRGLSETQLEEVK